MAPWYPSIFQCTFFYKLQEKTEKVTVYATKLEGALNVVKQEYPMMLSMSVAQKHLWY